MSDPRWLSDASEARRRALRQALDESPPFAPSDVRRRRVGSELARGLARRRVAKRAFMAGAALASALTAVAFLSAGHILKLRRAPVSTTRASAVAGARPTPRPAVASRPVAPERLVTEGPALRPPAPTEVGTTEEAEVLSPGSAVRTGAAERITRRLDADAHVEIQPRSSLVFDDGARPEVRSGEVRFDVPTQPVGKPFVARIASYFAVVAGARFAVRVDPGVALVTVQQGTVEIWRHGRIARVKAGESWRRSWREPSVRAPSLPALGPPSEGTSAGAAASLASQASDAYDLAAAREARASDPNRAISRYERILARGGPGAENALYQIGGIYHDQLHDAERALSAWERYRARYPRGQLRVEVDLSVLDTLAELGQESRALDEGLAFLRRHPTSERRGEVARVAADLARVRGQCRLAATLYAEVTRAQVPAEDVDDAAFGRASCLKSLGDAAANQALSEYLASHPHGRHVGEAQKLVRP